jgi:hypothetical protein
MGVEDLFQALYQDREFFSRYNITHVKGVHLYFTPCDEHGDAVTICDPEGNPIHGYVSSGRYHPAAEAFEKNADVQPRPLSRPRYTP